jgi:hypothetical protein
MHSRARDEGGVNIQAREGGEFNSLHCSCKCRTIQQPKESTGMLEMKE